MYLLGGLNDFLLPSKDGEFDDDKDERLLDIDPFYMLGFWCIASPSH